MRQAVSSGSQLGSLNCCGRYWNTGATCSVSALGSGTCRPATQNWLGPTALASVSPHVALVTTAPSPNLSMPIVAAHFSQGCKGDTSQCSSLADGSKGILCSGCSRPEDFKKSAQTIEPKEIPRMPL